ncbi:MAG: hypothetical protein AAGI38_03340 [Bacteroidota bacterium]
MDTSYLDPFDIFDLPVRKIDPAALRKAYQALMAEMKLEETGTTMRGGKRISRDQVMQLYEHLGDPEVISAYEELATHSNIRNFLIKGDADALSGLDAQVIISIGSYAFFKPVLHQQLSKCLVNSLIEGDPEGVKKVVYTVSEFSQAERNDLWLPSRKWLLLQQEEVASVRASIKGGNEPNAKIQDVADELLISCLAELPKEFLALTDGYVRHLESLAITLVQASGRIRLASWVLGQALKVPAFSSTHEHVHSVMEQLGISPPTSDSPPPNTSEKVPMRFGLWIGGALILAYFVFKALS